MDVKKMEESIEQIKTGLDLFMATFKESVKEDLKTPEKKETIKSVESVEEMVEEIEETGFVLEEMANYPYNELKSIATGFGLNGKGTREEIETRITSYFEGDKESNVVSIDEAKSKKAEEIEEVDEIPEWISELNDYTVEELADILTDADIKPTGKKQSLINKVVKAVESGKIIFEEEVEEVEDLKVADIISEESYELAINRDVEIKLSEKYESWMIDHIRNFVKATDKDGKVTNPFTVKELEEMPEDFLLEVFNTIELIMSDEGEPVEFEDAYQIGDDWYCCGHALGKDLHCNVCGTTWE